MVFGWRGRKKHYMTMSDIAKCLGVSVNTVSRALRDKDEKTH
jgi:transcriptional regulator with XRE-family HTH domain